MRRMVADLSGITRPMHCPGAWGFSVPSLGAGGIVAFGALGGRAYFRGRWGWGRVQSLALPHWTLR